MSTADNNTTTVRINQAMLAHLLAQPAFRCPLNEDVVLTDPVILAASGLSYDRAAITEYLALYGTDPETDRAMGPGTGPQLSPRGRRLLENPSLRELIARMVQSVTLSPLDITVEPEGASDERVVE